MILSDNDINKRLYEIFPRDVIDEGNVQPASVDLTLSDDLKSQFGKTFDLSDEEYLLLPQEFMLASTSEYVHIPSDLVGIVNGKSSLGRLGLLVHITAGYIDPNFKGNITLELYNVGKEAIVLRSGMKICQLVLEQLSSVPRRLYGDTGLGSHYQESEGTICSRWEK